MAVVQKTCPQCGSQVPVAVLRCRDCGNRFPLPGETPVAVPLTTKKQTSEKHQPARDQQQPASPAPPAVTATDSNGLDDLLAQAEDAVGHLSDIFHISDSTLRESPPPATRPARTASGQKTANPTSTTSKSTSNSAATSNSKHATNTQPAVTKRAANAANTAPPEANTSSADSAAFVKSPSGVGRGRERSRRDGAEGGSSPLQLAIRKAFKLTPQAEGSLAPESEQPSPADLKKLQKTWAKTVKQCRSTLQEHFDEQGRAAVTALTQAIEELSTVKTDEAVEILASYLLDARPAVREAAARGLGETQRVSAFEPLVKQLAHESSDLRGACIHGLGTLGDRRAIGPLLTLASEDPQFNLRACDALVKLGERAVPQLINVAEEAEPGQMLIAVMALGRLRDSRALEVLATRTTHPLHTLRSHAVEALGVLGESKGIRYLVRSLQDPHVSVRIQAAIALRKLADKRACDALMHALHDPDDDVREQAAAALATCGDQAAIPALIELLHSKQTSLCLMAAESLGKLGAEPAVPHLCAMLQQDRGGESKPVRLKILDALRRLKPATAVPVLTQLLQDPAAEIRERAVETLGHIGEVSVVVELEKLLREDKSEEVRSACAKALGEIGDPESAQVLEEALDDTVQVRIKAVIALGQIGNAASLLVLTALLRDMLPELRYHASQALAEIGDQRSLRPIEVLALDADPMVSRGAFKALQKMGDTRSEKEILKAAKKRGGKTPSLKAKRSQLRDWVNPAVLRDLVWPDDSKKRMIVLGIAGGGVSIGLLAMMILFGLSEKVIVRRGYPLSASLSLDGKKIVNGRSHGMIEIWSIKAKRPDAIVNCTSGPVTGVSYVGPNNVWFTAGPNIMRYDGSKQIAVAQLKDPLVRLLESADRKRLAFLDRAGNLYVYDSGTAQPVGSLAFPGVKQLEFSPSGNRVAAVVGKEIKIFDLKGAEQATLACETPILGLALQTDDSQLAVCHGKQAKLTLYQIANVNVVHELTPEKPLEFSRMLFKPDGKEVVLLALRSGSEWKGVGGWKPEQATLTFQPDVPPSSPADFNSSANLLCWVEEETAPVFVYDLTSKGASKLNYNPQ